MPTDCAIICVAIVYIILFGLLPALLWYDERKVSHGNKQSKDSGI